MVKWEPVECVPCVWAGGWRDQWRDQTWERWGDLRYLCTAQTRHHDSEAILTYYCSTGEHIVFSFWLLIHDIKANLWIQFSSRMIYTVKDIEPGFIWHLWLLSFSTCLWCHSVPVRCITPPLLRGQLSLDHGVLQLLSMVSVSSCPWCHSAPVHGVS